MSDVIDINEAKPHLTGTARCFNCEHTWGVVIPVGGAVTDLECPQCYAVKGYLMGSVLEPGETWHCNCGSDLFRVRDDHFYCAVCGTQQVFP